MYHYRKTRKSYEQKVNSDKTESHICTFCRETTYENIIEQNNSMYIVPNRVAYDVFEGKGVEEHLLLVPKRHVDSLSELTDNEKIDALSLIGKYEQSGYSIYARAVNSTTRSVSHQHTHLIKQELQQARMMVYLKRPYTLFKL